MAKVARTNSIHGIGSPAQPKGKLNKQLTIKNRKSSKR
jgi:hypothetical protein